MKLSRPIISVLFVFLTSGVTEAAITHDQTQEYDEEHSVKTLDPQMNGDSSFSMLAFSMLKAEHVKLKTAHSKLKTAHSELKAECSEPNEISQDELSDVEPPHPPSTSELAPTSELAWAANTCSNKCTCCKRAAECRLAGDPHIKTFDDRELDAVHSYKNQCIKLLNYKHLKVYGKFGGYKNLVSAMVKIDVDNTHFTITADGTSAKHSGNLGGCTRSTQHIRKYARGSVYNHATSYVVWKCPQAGLELFAKGFNWHGHHVLDLFINAVPGFNCAEHPEDQLCGNFNCNAHDDPGTPGWWGHNKLDGKFECSEQFEAGPGAESQELASAPAPANHTIFGAHCTDKTACTANCSGVMVQPALMATATKLCKDLPRVEKHDCTVDVCTTGFAKAVAAAAHESAAIDKVIKKEDAALNKGAK